MGVRKILMANIEEKTPCENLFCSQKKQQGPISHPGWANIRWVSVRNFRQQQQLF